MKETKMFSVKKRGGGETTFVHKDHVEELAFPDFKQIEPFRFRCTKRGKEVESGILNISNHIWDCHARKINFSIARRQTVTVERDAKGLYYELFTPSV